MYLVIGICGASQFGEQHCRSTTKLVAKHGVQGVVFGTRLVTNGRKSIVICRCLKRDGRSISVEQGSIADVGI